MDDGYILPYETTGVDFIRNQPDPTSSSFPVETATNDLNPDPQETINSFSSLDLSSINLMQDSPNATTSSVPLQSPTKLGHGKVFPTGNRSAKHGTTPSDPARWRVPTILALTVAIGLGSALAIFLAIIAWRKVRKLRELQRRDAAMREIGH